MSKVTCAVMGCILAIAMAAPASWAVELPTKNVLTIDVAKQMAGAAVKKAAAEGYKITIAIVDDGGRTMYLERMDGANPSSADTSLSKAVCSALYKAPTKNYADRLSNGETLLLRLPDVMPVEGGFPIVVNGNVIGAVGVGGAPKGQLDAAIAQTAIDWLTANLK